MRAVFAVLLIVSVSLFGAVGCGDSDDEKVEKAAKELGMDVDKDGTSIKVKGDDGETTELTTDTKLPDDWPDELDLPDGAEVTGYFKVGGKDAAETASASTDDSVDDVVEYFEDNMSDAGWKLDNNMDSGSGKDAVATRSWTKGDQAVYVTVGPDPAGGKDHAISISLGPANA
jgi:hypothetical protein